MTTRDETAPSNDEPQEGGKHGEGNDQSDRAERGDGLDHWFEEDIGQRAPLRAGGFKPQEGDRADGHSGKDADRPGRTRRQKDKSST